MKTSFFFVAIVLCFLSCNYNADTVDKVLTQAENLVEQYPDSASNLLKDVKDPEDLEESLHNKYVLLNIEVKDKNAEDISNDTLILKAKEYYKKVGDTKRSALSAFYLGRVLLSRKEAAQAIPIYLEAEIYANQTDDNNLKGLIQYDLARIYHHRALPEEAIRSQKRAIEYFKKAENIQNEMYGYERLATTFIAIDKTDSALYYFQKSLSIAKNLNDSLVQGPIYRNMGYTALKANKPILAREYGKESLKYKEKNENQARAYTNISNTFDRHTEKDSASYYLNKALELLKDQPLLANMHESLSKQAEADKNYQEALSYYKEYTKVMMKGYDNIIDQNVLNAEKKYNFQLMQNENNRLLIEKQSFLLLALGLILVILTMGFILYRKNAKSKQALLSAQQKIYQLKDMAESLDGEKDSFRNVLLRHFDILKKAALLEGYLREEEKIQGQKLLKKFNETVYGQETLDWNELIETMNHLYKGFPDFVKKRYPQLDEAEFRICCLTYAKLNNTEIAIIMGLSINTIQAKKTYLRKKLKIEGYGSITDFLGERMENEQSAISGSI